MVRGSGDRSRSVPWFGVSGEAEEAFADDVALDLAGAAGDGEAAVGEEPELPLGAGTDVGGPLGPEEEQAELLGALVVLDAAQLADAHLRAGLGAGDGADGRAQPHDGEGVRFGDQL